MTGVAGQGEAAAAARQVSRRFNGRTVLDRLDLTIAPGEFVALLGASGSGKTTLLRLFAGLDAPDEGAMLLPRNRSVVFQEARLLPSWKVWRNVVVGLRGDAGLRARAEAALAETGIAARADAWPSTLSGGEAQRVALARALVREPELLLLDEPFASLDALTRLRMQGLVAAIWQRHRQAILLVTHDVEEAMLLADRIVILEDGKVGYDEAIALPRPRAAFSERFAEYKKVLIRRLGVEVG
ncbi:MAG: ABC transporter ATP-binding protein [Sphingomonas sp.]